MLLIVRLSEPPFQLQGDGPFLFIYLYTNIFTQTNQISNITAVFQNGTSHCG